MLPATEGTGMPAPSLVRWGGRRGFCHQAWEGMRLQEQVWECVSNCSSCCNRVTDQSRWGGKVCFGSQF